jgi:hypothetical protein
MASSAQPTRPDLESPSALQNSVAKAAKPWFLRFRGRDDRWYRVRTTTKQIADRLRDGRLPADAQARPDGESDFRSVRDFPEFRGIQCRRSSGRKARKAKVPAAAPPVREPSVNGHAVSLQTGKRPRWNWRRVAVVAAVAALLVAGVAVYLLRV